MLQYKDFAPTQFDVKGLGLPDRQEWWVVPIPMPRGSGVLERSNYRTALRILSGEGSPTVEEYVQEHWAFGLVHIILVHPSREKDVAEIEAALDDYPILDEDDYESLESEQIGEDWESYGRREFVQWLIAHEVQEETLEWLEKEGLVHDLFCELGGETEYSDGEGTYFGVSVGDNKEITDAIDDLK